MRLLRFAFLMCFVIASSALIAQDTLPDFTATTRGKNRVIIGWTNTYKYVSQISIQRSTDSVKNFSTILTVPDPMVPQNGFVDTKGPNTHLYYRLFIVLDSGKYVFSKSRRPTWDTANIASAPTPAVNTNTAPVANVPRTPATPVNPAPKEPEKFYTVVRRDSIVGKVSYSQYRRFRDSVILKTRDTITMRSFDTVQIRPFVPREVYRPSRYVYTERDGSIAISLPDAHDKKYSVRFFEDDQSFLFEVRQIKDNYLLLDKVNFHHSGWFRFELYDGSRLVERHRFFIPKEF